VIKITIHRKHSKYNKFVQDGCCRLLAVFHSILYRMNRKLLPMTAGENESVLSEGGAMMKAAIWAQTPSLKGKIRSEIDSEVDSIPALFCVYELRRHSAHTVALSRQRRDLKKPRAKPWDNVQGGNA